MFLMPTGRLVGPYTPQQEVMEVELEPSCQSEGRGARTASRAAGWPGQQPSSHIPGRRRMGSLWQNQSSSEYPVP
ncbi:hypothetical protein Y1Q_0001669 [Alligator mississippiensis]|uniref:Uncharacterized protein n=1 Tax=Alligator mississippiensis TaxID=8496 RepID=A0A151MAM3_ALLMI|nr:hypothetical protein Y1Q_0001669 [Alligator mississippiensis]